MLAGKKMPPPPPLLCYFPLLESRKVLHDISVTSLVGVRVALAQVRGFFFWVPCLPHGYRYDRQTKLNLSEHVWQAGVLIFNISLP